MPSSGTNTAAVQAKRRATPPRTRRLRPFFPVAALGVRHPRTMTMLQPDSTIPSAAVNEPPATLDTYEQLRLRLWAAAPDDGPARPDKALFRELFDLAHLTGTARLVCWEIASYTSRHGKCQLRIKRLADSLEISTRTIKAAIAEIRQSGALRTHRTRGALIFELAIGGWFRNARRPRKPPEDQPKLLLVDVEEVKLASPLEVKPASPLKIKKGCTSKGRDQDSIAAAGTPARESSDEDQQQRRRHDRIEGLIAAIAARARQLGMKYDEADERRGLERGEIDVDALQAHADELGEMLRAQRRHRALGPGRA